MRKYKEWHAVLWSVVGTAFYFFVCKVVLFLFPQIPESTVLAVGILPYFLLMGTVSWGYYTNWGRQIATRDDEEGT